MRLARFGGVVTISVLAVVGCSTSSTKSSAGAVPELAGEPVMSIGQAIQAGVSDTTHHFAVGLCGGRRNPTTPQNIAEPCSSYCSGALITPNLVLTARHCVSSSPREINCKDNIQFGGMPFANNYWITTSPNVKGNADTGWHKVKQIIVPDDPTFCGNDIALLVLDDMIASSEAAPIVPGIQYSMLDPKYKREFTAIGYGATSPSTNDFGVRRRKEGIPIKYVGCDANDGPVISCAKDLSANEWVGGTGVCGGDSGSSAYEQGSYTSVQSKFAVSLGVLSRGGDSADGTACLGSLYTRVDKFRTLILDAANTASANWTLYPKPVPDWTGPFVAPPVESDAGTDAPPPPAGSALGEACNVDLDCLSQLCLDQGAGPICVQSCEDGAVPSTCPDGYTCQGGACAVAPASTSSSSGAAATPATVTESGCSTAGATSTSGAGGVRFAGALGLALGALAIARRRARRSLRTPES